MSATLKPLAVSYAIKFKRSVGVRLLGGILNYLRDEIWEFLCLLEENFIKKTCERKSGDFVMNATHGGCCFSRKKQILQM